MLRFVASKIKDGFLDVLFPPLCALCGRTINYEQREDGICAPCVSAIPIKTAFTCPICRARLAENKKVCHKGALFYLAAASSYDDQRVKKLVWQLKYEKQTHAARALACLILDHLGAMGIAPEDFTLVPIPLHRIRERKRGFNQAELMSTFLSHALHLPVERKALVRIKNTPAQAEAKNRDERKQNIAGSFRAHEALVSGKNIFLVDDVFTSGATIEEAVRMLKDAGAKQVVALVAALA